MGTYELDVTVGLGRPTGRTPHGLVGVELGRPGRPDLRLRRVHLKQKRHFDSDRKKGIRVRYSV